MNILGAVLLLSVSIFVHELGHYLEAVAHGVKVRSFSIGLGPKLFKLFTWRNTEFIFSVFPFGGYVNFDNGEDEDELLKLNPGRRWRVLVAGPLANALFAGLLLAAYTLASAEQPFTILQIVLLFFVAEVVAMLGTLALVPLSFVALFDVFSSNVGGPATIVSTLAGSGNNWLFYAALINASIGAFNLLPLPILDGGHLVNLIFDRVKNKTGRIIIKWIKITAGVLLFITLLRSCIGDIRLLF